MHASYDMPEPNSWWMHRDGRVHQVVRVGGYDVLMYSPVTNRHWHTNVTAFFRNYSPAPAIEEVAHGECG